MGLFNDMLSSAWFKRLWVVQEVLANEHVAFQWGSKSVPWEPVAELARMLFGHPLFVSFKRPSVSLLKRIQFIKRQPRQPLEDLVRDFSVQRVRDPRDYVYGLLSLVGETEVECVSPSYEKSVEEVFTDFARVMIDIRRRKNMLNKVQLNVAKLCDIPSWAPDWRLRPMTEDGGPREMRADSFNVSGSCPESWHFSESEKVLKIKGLKIDSISVRGAEGAFDDDDKRFYPTSTLVFLQAHKAMAESCGCYNEKSSDILLCRTMSRGTCDLDDRTVDRAVDVLHMYRSILQASPSPKIDLIRLDSGSLLRTKRRLCIAWARAFMTFPSMPPKSPKRIFTIILDRFADYFFRDLVGNRITKTRSGLLANVPGRSEAGDIVAIFYGWKTPFLLRPVEKGYLLVGECYVHGIMNGEAIEKDMGTEEMFDVV